MEKRKLKRQQSNKTKLVTEKAAVLLRLLHGCHALLVHSHDLAQHLRDISIGIIVIINGPRITGMCRRLKLINKCFELAFSRLLPQYAGVFLKRDLLIIIRLSDPAMESETRF